MQLANYLFFTNHCEQALAFYAQCGLGAVTLIWRYGENGRPLKNEEMRGLVMHARFEGSGVLFYASDNDDAEPMRGSAHLLTFDDPILLRQVFDRLAEEGQVTTPLAVQSWGDLYGKLTDRFGVQWMFNASLGAKS